MSSAAVALLCFVLLLSLFLAALARGLKGEKPRQSPRTPFFWEDDDS